MSINLLRWTTPELALSAIGYGLSPSTNRQVDTILGQQLRYAGHEETEAALRIVQEEPGTGLRITSVFEALAGVRAWSEASLVGPGALELTLLSSLVVGLASDREHQWSVELTADKPFTTVPVSLVAGTDRDSVFAALTRQRRAVRNPPPAYFA